MDDDDAFLYGDDGSEAPHPADAAHAVPPPAESKPPDDDNGNSSVMEESDEEDSSDEDLEIVMDAPDATAKPVSAAKNNVPIQPQMLRAHIPGAKQPLPTQLSAPPAPSPTVSAPSPISKQPGTFVLQAICFECLFAGHVAPCTPALLFKYGALLPISIYLYDGG